MCGRFVISSDNPFGLKFDISYNIIPHQLIPVKIKDDVKLMKWSYAPLWKKNMNIINCRSETMHKKSSFTNAKKCVIYNDGWYEWQKKGKEKIPFYHYSTFKNFAGLYNDIGCLILTRNSIEKINHIHHRQPVLLNDSDVSSYLNGENITHSNANNNINFHTVSKNVNNPKNNNPSLIEEINLF